MKRVIVFLALASLIVSACASGTAQPGATVTTATPKAVRIGMVTDLGALEDKSFNENSWKGVQEGTKAIAGTAQVIVTKDVADYKQNIQQFVDQKYDVIVTVGFLIGSETLKAALANPGIQFIGVDQFICVAADAADKACKGALPKNYQGLLYREAQAGYLAGIVAATITKSNKIGAIGGRSDVPPVVDFIKGYEKGAKAEKPAIQVSVTYTEDFNAPDKGESTARTMIGQGVDVIFQVAGGTGAAALRAACNAKIWGIGVDVDQYNSLPDAKACIVTSAEKKLFDSIVAGIKRWKAEGPQSGNLFHDAKNGGIGYSPIRNLSPVPAGLEAKLAAALEDMKSGKIDPYK